VYIVKQRFVGKSNRFHLFLFPNFKFSLKKRGEKVRSRKEKALGQDNGQSEPAPLNAAVGRSVHRMGWMIRLFFIHLFTLR
jgi:hypothetical protein